MKILLCFVSLAACTTPTVPSQATGAAPPPMTVESVDIPAFLGKWYEVRRIPNSFQDNKPFAGYGVCKETTATYSLLKDNRVQVENECTRMNEAGQTRTEIARAIARSVSGSNNSKLKVNFTGIALLRFLGIGDGDYWVLGLGPIENGKYSWLLVGSPDRNYGWVLTRDPQPTPELIQNVLGIAEAKGYRPVDFQCHRIGKTC